MHRYDTIINAKAKAVYKFSSFWNKLADVGYVSPDVTF